MEDQDFQDAAFDGLADEIFDSVVADILEKRVLIYDQKMILPFVIFAIATTVRRRIR